MSIINKICITNKVKQHLTFILPISGIEMFNFTLTSNTTSTHNMQTLNNMTTKTYSDKT